MNNKDINYQDPCHNIKVVGSEVHIIDGNDVRMCTPIRITKKGNLALRHDGATLYISRECFTMEELKILVYENDKIIDNMFEEI